MATALVFVVDPQTTFGVVSDIDDTVMVTALPRPLLAAWHTFVVNEHARATTPGMPVLYERISSRYPGAPFIYLSTGAWNVAPTLTRFLSRNLYPAGALLLTDWGPQQIGGSAVVASTSAAVWSAWRASSLRSSGCWSVTTGSTMSRSTATLSRNIPTTWRRSAFGS